MALTTLDKKPVDTARTPWSPEITAEFERERTSPNGCVGQKLVSESARARVWHITLKPGERLGFHRHVLDYFWSVLTAGRARAHMDDGSTVEHSYTPGETRHETHAAGHFKVHDLENIGDSELIFCTVEFLDSANKPLPIPDTVRLKV
jgi:mannose-6-phosphate isomerase-like protein (cupin superfamily)